MRQRRRAAIAALWLSVSASAVRPGVAHCHDQSVPPKYQGLGAGRLAVVINTADPLSTAIGEYYVRRRHIPSQNIARVSFGYHRAALPADEFASLKEAIDAQVRGTVQAYALTWARPYRVDCMSITSAFAFGFDRRFCANGCMPTRLSPYFDADSAAPYDDLHVRPAMSIAAVNIAQARALIDRGVNADGSMPLGTAYLVTGDDPAREVRAAAYGEALRVAAGRVSVSIVHTEGLQYRNDVMFYFIGAMRVPWIDSNRFLPGAIADHLTSYGGDLTQHKQMNSLRWLEAGATGSYGTVVEPCNFLAKFPSPAVLMRHYLAGETLMESYWKSVAMPGQGLFIGEPLAAPYRRTLAADPGARAAIGIERDCGHRPFTCSNYAAAAGKEV